MKYKDGQRVLAGDLVEIDGRYHGVVIAAIDEESSIPAIEQFAATAAACENMLLAATALKVGSMWRTGDASYDPFVKAALMLKETDMIVGWLYFGSAHASPEGERSNDEPMNALSYWA